jgi:adenylate kinase
VYRAQTLPVLDWYRGDGAVVRTIDAIGTVDEVTRRALDALGLRAA